MRNPSANTSLHLGIPRLTPPSTVPFETLWKVALAAGLQRQMQALERAYSITATANAQSDPQIPNRDAVKSLA